ncbi:alanine racemase [Streptomyces sp. NPDC006367]|uniref:alanine racemase n=1 Tax=unclassified Streptomyces TaxID=2593676 RepID=UPI0033B5B2F3
MPLVLTIDTVRWQRHQQRVAAEFPGLVPVCKGDGYGFGQDLLVRRAAALDVPLLAVGTTGEAERAQRSFSGDLMVLVPHQAGETPAPASDRIVRVVSSPHGHDGLRGRRVVVKLASSMRRHGIAPDELPAVRAAMGAWEFEGFSLHLPLRRHPGSGGIEEVSAWMRHLVRARMPVRTLFVSHLSAEEVATLHTEFPGTDFRLRAGTRLWLGDPKATRYSSDVLDVTPLDGRPRPGRFGRRGAERRFRVTAAGGVSHGVGLKAPRTLQGVRERLRHVAGIGYASLNMHLSPFVWDGQRCRFAEPPHLMESVLLVSTETPPEAGDEMRLLLRHTTTRPDVVRECPPVDPAPSGAAGQERGGLADR